MDGCVVDCCLQVGFDPLNISGVDFDFSKLIVPNLASMRKESDKVVVDTLYWMREAELKHSRQVPHIAFTHQNTA